MKNYRILFVFALALLTAACGVSGRADGEQPGHIIYLQYGGQDIFCIPSLNLVVAFTGQNYTSGEALPFSLMQDYILESITN